MSATALSPLEQLALLRERMTAQKPDEKSACVEADGVDLDESFVETSVVESRIDIVGEGQADTEPSDDEVEEITACSSESFKDVCEETEIDLSNIDELLDEIEEASVDASEELRDERPSDTSDEIEIHPSDDVEENAIHTVQLPQEDDNEIHSSAVLIEEELPDESVTACSPTALEESDLSSAARDEAVENKIELDDTALASTESTNLDELEGVPESELSLDFTDLEIDEDALVQQYAEAKRVDLSDDDPAVESGLEMEGEAQPVESDCDHLDETSKDESSPSESRYVKTGRGAVRKVGAGASSDLDALFARVSDLLGEPEADSDEPWKPPVPETMADTGLVDEDVERIVLKFLSARGSASGRQISAQLRLPFRLVEPLLAAWKQAQLIAFKNAAEVGDYVYVITETGRSKASAYMAESTYFGAAPVQLVDYLKAMEEQSIAKQNATEDDLQRAFSDLLISPAMLERLGPAVNSGRGMFLFGEPGNGKTSIAERITSCFGSTIWIPRALGVDGDIIRLFDPGVHEAVDWDDTGAANSSLFDVSGVDPRWVRITRPTVVAGGELTMDELEVTQNPQTKVCEAPLQLKSNCGTLVIDDFGRQTMPVDVLLNRWIVPLEKRYDFLNLPSGKKIQVPFDQLIVFSTNLEPKDLVDGAFLRRIPYKIEVPDPLPEHFRKLFHIMAPNLGLRVDDDAIEYLITEHFEKADRPFRACLPRDLLLQVRNYCNYKSTPKVMTREAFDFAVANYFSVM